MEKTCQEGLQQAKRMDLLVKTHVLDDVIADREEEILWYLHAGTWVESVVADNHDRELNRGRVLQA